MNEVKFLEAEVWTVARTEGGNAVLVRPKGSEKVVPIFIGQLEAQSILIGLGNVPMPRPLTHDLILNLFRELGVELLKVEICDLREATFYARLVLSHEGKTLVIDSRPSDALALAVRMHCPVYVADFVVQETAISVQIVGEEEEQAPDPRQLEVSRLEEELKKAIENERYEEAARIRDRLRELRNSQ
ncbi:bifunctional nuclease family protein [Spirochaeta thermophila]|uniref:BFN domain-containing protein n=1 Tax=Winmispira thermophila (strain ATCC 49972 / DSM 6192 / RI 19.B1) TaxID=665571 RepID=E0RTC9_WINT6|nr:bifunctional nuclease family protein [Spirochaeta thermophila]ADN00995.1 hypothetical protein STHERM_c00190 [Spirochaeta thermophila DSM 6192]